MENNMKMWRRSIPPIKWLRPKSALLSFFPMVVLTAVLAACGTTTSTTGATPGATTQATATTAATPTSQNTTAAPSKPTVPLLGIRMLNTKNGWALTAQSILKTTDGGVHWKDVTPANAGINSFTKGNFLNEQFAWIAVPPAQGTEGPGITILRTTNGGGSWQRAKIADPRVAYVDVPHFVDTQQGWLEASSTPGAGHAGSDIWHSTDGGQTWTQIASNATNNGLDLPYVSGISFKDRLNGIATGNRGAGGDNSQPAIAVTRNGGKSWQTQSLPHLLGGYTGISNNTLPPVFIGNTVILPVNVSTSSGDRFVLYRSNNSGQTWAQTTVVNIHSDNAYVLDGSHAWASDAQSGRLYSTADGGSHWTQPSTSAPNLKALSFTDVSNGWGVTKDTLQRTADGGKTWQRVAYTIQ